MRVLTQAGINRLDEEHFRDHVVPGQYYGYNEFSESRCGPELSVSTLEGYRAIAAETITSERSQVLHTSTRDIFINPKSRVIAMLDTDGNVTTCFRSQTLEAKVTEFRQREADERGVDLAEMQLMPNTDWAVEAAATADAGPSSQPEATPDKKERALAERDAAEAAYGEALDRLTGLRAAGAAEHETDAAEAQCIQLSAAVRDVDNRYLRQAVRDEGLEPLFPTMAEELDEARADYRSTHACLTDRAVAEGWSEQRLTAESERLEADWDRRLERAYPSSDVTAESNPPSPDLGVTLPG